MSVAPAPVTYTATNDLNVLKNIFTPAYLYNGAYFTTRVDTHLPGNVSIGDSTTNFSNTLNGIQIATISHVQSWSQWSAGYNLNMNNNSILQVSNIAFGGNSTGTYTINAPQGSINISSYFLNGRYTDLSGGIPSWATRPASSNVNMNSCNIQSVGNVTFASGVTLSSSSNIIAFSNSGVETMRLSASNRVVIGAPTNQTPYGLTVSGGAIFLSNFYVTGNGPSASAPWSTASNSLSIIAGPNSAQIGAIGPSTNLLLGTAGTDQVQIDTGGTLTVLNAGISVPKGTVTAFLDISAATSPVVLSSNNQARIFVVTANTSISLAGSTPARGMYWTIKNAGSSTITNTVVAGSGTIINGVNPLLTMSANALVTVVAYNSGQYYAL